MPDKINLFFSVAGNRKHQSKITNLELVARITIVPF